MTSRRLTGRRGLPIATNPRVGLFGLLGSGNTGNDAQLESMLAYLRTDHPDAIVDAMCMGAGRLRDQYGIEAIPHLWYQKYDQRVRGVSAMALKVIGKGIDAFKTASWVRRHDVVIVPGGGVLETTLPLWPWGVPYAIFLLCASGRIFGTKVALVSVGANIIDQRTTRLLFNSAAKLAFYRSYRDTQSRDAMRQRGLDTTRDHVYADLAFAVPTPPFDPGDAQTVGVGVMGYYGGNGDRRHADQIYASYVEKMKFFVCWLVDSGHKVRLFGGDNRWDDHVAQEIVADVRASRPDLEPTRVITEPASSFAELMRAMAPVGIVVATRYHNVVCALKLCKPTISLGYSQKFISLMADMGLSEFCQATKSLDVDLLIKQFTELESRSMQLRQAMRERNAANARLLEDQFGLLSTVLFPTGEPAHAAALKKPPHGSAR